MQATLIPFTVLSVILINLGSGRHFAYIQYVLDNVIVSRTEALDFWAHLVYTTCLLVCRLSGLAFFSRIADRQKKLTWAIRIVAGVMIALWIPQMALIIFHCIPVTAYWPYAFEVNAEKYQCLQWGIVYVTNSAISLLCDLALFTIPAVIIAQLRISKFDKLKLAGIMMPGLLVIAISCTRMYLVIVGQWQVSSIRQCCSSSTATDMLILGCIGRSILELQQPAHHRSGRNRLDSRRPVGARTQAILRQDLRVPRRHIRLARFFGTIRQHQHQAGELVPFCQFSKEGY